MSKNILLIAIISFTFTFPSFAQDGRYTESEIKLQQLFIDATSKKILGKYDKAAELFKSIIKKDPQNHAAYFSLGQTLEQLNQPSEALENIEKAANLEPQNQWYWKHLASFASEQKNEAKAIEAYSKLIRLDKTNKTYYLKKAMHQVRNNNQGKAITTYEQMENIFGFDEEVIRRKHTLYLGQNKFDKAGIEIEKLTKADPSSVDYWLLQAGFYDQIKKHNLAKKAYQKVLQIDPNNAKARIATASKAKNEGGDISYLKSLITVFQDDSESIDTKIEALLPYIEKIGITRDPALIEITNTLAETLKSAHPENPKAFSIAGDISYYSNDLSAAIENYEKTLTINKKVFAVWEQLMEALKDQGNYKKLLKISTQSLDYFPNKARVFLLNGIANNELENYSEASSILNEGLFMTKRTPQIRQEILTTLALSNHLSGKKDKATKNITAADKLGKSIYTKCTLSKILSDNGKSPKEILEELIKNFPNEKQVIQTQASIAFNEGKFDETIKTLEQLNKKEGFLNSSYLELLGDAYSKKGENELAQKLWQKAIETGNSKKSLRNKTI